MNSYWTKKALKRKGIKGEHAYLEAVEDMNDLFNKTIKKLTDVGDLNSLRDRQSLVEIQDKYFKRK